MLKMYKTSIHSVLLPMVATKWRSLAGISLAIVLMLITTSISAQTLTPEYDNTGGTTPTGGNSIPFSWNANGVRGQMLIPAQMFKDGNNQSAPGGQAIKTLYIYPTSGTFSSPVVYTRMVIKIGQPNITTLPTTWYSTDMTTVVNATNYAISGGMNQWCEVPLTVPYNFDPNKPLLIDVSWPGQQSYNLYYIANKTQTSAARAYATPSTSTSGTVGANYMYIIGMDLISLGPNNAGISAVTDPKNFCAGTYDVKVDVTNSGTNQLDSVRIDWSVDGVGQNTLYYRNTIDTSGSSNGNTANITLGKVAFGTTPRLIKVWTAFPNGVRDTVNDDDTLEVRLGSAMSGSYTIGGTNPDYTRISDAVADLNNFGLCGPVSFDIRAGTYNERVELNNIAGASATNTISFTGAGKSQTIVSSTGSNTGNFVTWLVDGTDYVKMRDMTIRAPGSTYGVALMVTGGSDYGQYDNMDLECNTSARSSWSVPLAVVGSTTSTTAYGNSANHCTFDSLRMIGGYYSTVFNGSGTTSPCTNNTISNCEMTQAYYYGIRSYYQDEIVFDNNIIHNIRNTVNYGAYTYYWSDVTFTNNEIYAIYYGHMNYYMNRTNYTSSNKTLYANNIVSSATGTGNSYYGLYAYYSQNVDYYHNTFISRYTSSTVGTVYAYYNTNTNWVNNIFINDNTGAASNAWAYRLGSIGTFDHNIFDVKGGSVAYHDGNGFSTLSAFQASYPNYNQNSYQVSPDFAANYRLDPTKQGYRGVDVGVVEDVDGDSRCVFAPSIGADESGFPTPTTRAFFTTNDTLFVNSPSQFNNQAKATDPLVHEWYINNSYVSNDVDLLARFPSTGSYTVTLVSEGCGGVDTFSRSVYVDLPTNAPTADFMAITRTIDVNESISFTNLTTDGPDSFYWSVDSYFVMGPFNFRMKSHQYINGTDSNSLNPEIEFLAPGEYTICLESYNMRGSDRICKTLYIKVRQAESMCTVSNGSTRNTGKLTDEGGILGNYSANRNCSYLIDPCTDEITLTFKTFDLAAGSYLRIYDGKDNDGKPLHSYNNLYNSGLTGSMNAQEFRTTLKATSGEVYIEFVSAGAVSSGFELLWEAKEVVNPAATSADFSIPDTVCVDVPFTAFNNSDGLDNNYIWFMDTTRINWFVGGDYDTEHAVHSYDTKGTYYVKLSAEGCSNADSLVKAIHVVDPTTAPSAAFTVSNNRPAIGDAVTLSSTSTSGNYPCILGQEWIISPNTYSINGNGTVNDEQIAISLSDTGCYDISLVVYNGAGSDTTTISCAVYSISNCIPNVKIPNTDIGISRVAIGSIDNRSDINEDGYESFINNASTNLEKGATYSITIERPTGGTNAMNRAVWIDYNVDGIFDNNTEMVVSTKADNNDVWTGSITIPTSAIKGSTRMRVGANLGSFTQYGCGPNQFGEFEDYRVFITEDSKAPVITLNGAADTTIEQCSAWMDPSATATDNVDGAVSLSGTLGSVDVSTTGKYTITYEATDAAGNVGRASRTVEVVADATEPVITLVDGARTTLEVFTPFADPGYSADDNCGGIDSTNVVVTGTIDNSELGIYTLTYEVEDNNGLSTTVTRTVEVVDTEAPVIVNVLGDNPANVEVLTQYTEAGVEWTENYDTAGLTYKVDGNVDVSTPGTYTLRYTVTDNSGNVSAEATRTVVVADGTAPVVRLALGDTTYYMDVYDTYTPEYVDINDNFSSESAVRSTLVVGGSYITNFGNGSATETGSYTYTYTVQDEAGNSTTITRDIVVEDNKAPVMTFDNGNTYVMPRWSAFDAENDVSYDLEDNYHADATLTLNIVSNSVDKNSVGTYQVVYEACDPDGNCANYTLFVVVNETRETVGIDEVSEITADLYPNPTNGQLNVAVTLPSTERVRIAVVNALGQEVMVIADQTTQTVNTTADLSALTAGVYNVTIVTPSQRMVKRVSLTD